MLSNTLFHEHAGTDDPDLTSERSLAKKQRWLNWLTGMIVVALFIAGIWMRLYLLSVPVARDLDDEGVYLQTLRAMSTGATLYQQIFNSQPPFFLLSIYPIYAFLGHTLWSARLGVAFISLFGLLGALLLGKILAGRLGMILALLLLVTSPSYLTASQTLMADGPATALMLLAVALAYLWRGRPDGIMGSCLATLAGIVLALSLLTKLLMLPVFALVGLLVCIHLWQVRRQASPAFLVSLCPMLIGGLAFVLTIIFILLPFRYALSQLWQTVVTYHISARQGYHGTSLSTNFGSIRHVLASLLGISAFFGAIVALLRRDWRVIPLLVWFSTTLDFLLIQKPLFSHHLVVLTPPLISLAIMGIAPIASARRLSGLLVNIATVLTVTLIFVQLVSNMHSIQALYSNLLKQNHSLGTKQEAIVAEDLRRFTKPNQLVITDAQFIAVLADRSTPDNLVDTSSVRIQTGYLKAQQLIVEASQPQVGAILFYTGRIYNQAGASFYNWVMQHFRLVGFYGQGKELWVKT